MPPQLKEKVISMWRYILASTCFGIFAFFLLLLSFVHTGVFFEWLLNRMCRGIIFCAGIRYTVEGKEHVDVNQQYIVMMNHVNIFDSFLLNSAFPGHARGMEEESHFNWPIYGWLIGRMGFIPVNRKDGRKAMVALKKAGDLIRQRKGFSVAILPEGTRTLTGKLGPFKKGGFLVALEAGLDILPMIQIGSFDIQNKINTRIRPGKVKIIIEKPISLKEYAKENIKELMEKTREPFLKYVD